MIALALLGVIAGAVALKPETYFRWADYPPSARRARSVGAVKTRVVVSPDGQPVRCDVLIPTKDPILNTATCDLLLKRSRYTPARDADGNQAFGTVERITIWSSDKPLTPASSADFELRLSKMPSGAKAREGFKLLLATDVEGAIGTCVAENDVTLPALVTIACRHVAAAGKLDPARDGDGKPVAAIQELTVAFVLDQPAP